MQQFKADGESGLGYRPDDIEWYRSLQRQCQAAGVPFYGKQRAALRPGASLLIDGREYKELPGLSAES